MSIDFFNSLTKSNSASRVACGEIIIDNKLTVHNESTIAYVTEGSLSAETEEGTFNLNRGDLFFVSPNQKYRINGSSQAKVQIILLNLSNPSAVTQEYIPQSIIRSLTTGNCTHFAVITPSNPCYVNVLADFNCITKAETKQFDFYQLLVHGKMYNMYYTLFSSGIIKIKSVQSHGKRYVALRKITENINENFSENISLDSLAKETGLSRYYISHLFKELMNTTFINYLNDLRLSHAAKLLTTTDIPIIEIAGRSGFNNISNFNRTFKMYYHMTPSKFRKSERTSNPKL